MFSLIDDQIKGSDDERRVTRRGAGAYDSLGSFTPGGDIVALVRCDIQTRGADLDRQLRGDRSQAGVNVFVTLEQLANAEAEGHAGVPLGWTEFHLAPADHTQGPPGDRIEFLGRIYEITREEPYDEPGPLIPPTRNYVAEDRGAV